jgi:hypothetical protein
MVETNPPARLAWTTRQGLYLAEYDYTVWALAAHSVHRGKSGWSGTDEWHLHRAYPDLDEVWWAGGIVPLKGRRVFQVVASNGTDRYLTARQACNCKAGLAGRHACYRRLAAELIAA